MHTPGKQSRSAPGLFLCALVLAGAWGLTFSPSASGDLIIDSDTTVWTPILYPNNNTPDPFLDQQTGSGESDLVGDALNPSFYMQFDNGGTPSLTDGTLAFRARLSLEKNPAGFSGALFVGIDANGDGAIDLFLGVDNSGSIDHVAIWDPGTDSNTSPSTTSIESPPIVSYTETSINYDWSMVDASIDSQASTYDVDGGGETDYFLSFSVPFDEVVAQLLLRGISINENTSLNFVMATATQDNSLNQDLNGVAGGINSDQTWADLGVESVPTSVSGNIPEPSTALLLVIGGLAVAASRRRNRLSR